MGNGRRCILWPRCAQTADGKRLGRKRKPQRLDSFSFYIADRLGPDLGRFTEEALKLAVHVAEAKEAQVRFGDLLLSDGGRLKEICRSVMGGSKWCKRAGSDVPACVLGSRARTTGCHVPPVRLTACLALPCSNWWMRSGEAGHSQPLSRHQWTAQWWSVPPRPGQLIPTGTKRTAPAPAAPCPCPLYHPQSRHRAAFHHVARRGRRLQQQRPLPRVRSCSPGLARALRKVGLRGARTLNLQGRPAGGGGRCPQGLGGCQASGPARCMAPSQSGRHLGGQAARCGAATAETHVHVHVPRTYTSWLGRQ